MSWLRCWTKRTKCGFRLPEISTSETNEKIREMLSKWRSEWRNGRTTGSYWLPARQLIIFFLNEGKLGQLKLGVIEKEVAAATGFLPNFLPFLVRNASSWEQLLEPSAWPQVISVMFLILSMFLGPKRMI